MQWQPKVLGASNGSYSIRLSLLVALVRPSATTQHPLISPLFLLPPDNLCPLELAYPPPYERPRVISLRALFWNRKFAIYHNDYTCLILRTRHLSLTPLDPAFVSRSPAAPHGHYFAGNTDN